MEARQKLGFALLVVSLILAWGSADAWGDVTGSFEMHLGLPTQSLASEIGMLEFDLQHEINLTVALSGLRTTFHSHFGLAGVEDVILISDIVIGSLDLESQMVFGRFDSGDPIPDKDKLAFIKKRVTARISLGGVRLQSLAMFEDTNFPQTSQFAFGDVLSLRGQTTSGINVTARTGICATKGSNTIKKHSWPYSVDPDCYSTPKPDLIFNFEDLNISGVPLGEGLTGDAAVTCNPPPPGQRLVTGPEADDDDDGAIDEDPEDDVDNDNDGQIDEDPPKFRSFPGTCEMINTLRFSGGIVPISGSVFWKDVFTFGFGGARMTLSSGVGTLRLRLDDTGNLNLVSVELAPVLNPDANPASLRIRGSLSPGKGLTSGSVGLRVSRDGFDFDARANFSGGPPASFRNARFRIGTTIGQIDVETSATFTLDGLARSDTYLTLSF